MRGRSASGPLSAVLLLLMLAGCLFLWVGVPLIWLWIGSRVQASVRAPPVPLNLSY